MELPDNLVARLGGVRSMGVITGAGVSAESGIPTYRGRGGIYDDPEEGDRTIEALSGPTLQADPDRTWRVVAELARRAGAARPNPAHLALVALEQVLDRFVLLTQNVDRLHHRAGNRNVIDIHGDTFATECMSCEAEGRLASGAALEELRKAPRCTCGGTLRPAVVLFGEMLPEAKLARIHAEFFVAPPDLVLVVGTTALFPYIVEPILYARSRGRLTIEVNPEATTLSEVVDFSLRAPGGTALPLIARHLGARL